MPDIATPDVPAESSPAIEVPRGSAEYAEWRQTGKLPAQPKPEASATSTESSAADKTVENRTASEAGNHQEKPKPPRDNAAARLNELLDDLRKAGYTPAELKTLKREAKTADQTVAPAKVPATEQTANPAELKAPVKPDPTKFNTYEEAEAAKDKYFEDLAEYKAAKAVEKFQQEQRQNAAQQTVRQKMEEARTRYASDPEAVNTISATARAITGDQQIPLAVKSILDQSPVWPDVLYTLGSKPEELQSFIQLAKENPGAAIRKAVVLEQLVTAELGKGGKPEAAAGETQRDESGKFVGDKKTPEKKESAAPPPPREVSGRGTTPPDEIAGAVKNNDFRRFRESQNAKDAAKHRGR